MRDFEDKVVLITGASTGLGAALAVGAAARGAKAVVVNYVKSQAEAEATAQAVRAAGAEAVLAQGDVADDAACRAIAEKAAPFGRIDALANNAGITKFAPAHNDMDALDRADFERLENLLVRKAGSFRIAGCRIAIQHKHLPGFKHRRAAGKFADAQFGPLQVSKDRRRPPERFFEPADRLDEFGLFGLRAVAHIDPKGVRPRLEQLLDHFGRAAGWAERGENAHLARTRGNITVLAG